MKRLRKMVHLSAVAEQMAHSKKNNTEKRLGLDLRVCQVLGPNISKRVEKISLNRNTLFLYVSEDVWRKQLSAGKAELLRHLSAAIPEIQAVQIKEFVNALQK